MKIKQLSVFSENKPGQIIGPCRLLADAGIDMRALSLADTQHFGILRMIVSDWQKAKSLLEKAGRVVKMTEVLAVEVPDRPGGLADVLGLSKDPTVNIEYMYAFPFGREEQGGAGLPLRPSGRRHRAAAGGGITVSDQRRPRPVTLSWSLRKPSPSSSSAPPGSGACSRRAPASSVARGGERLRLHAGQPRRGAAARGARSARTSGAGAPPALHGYMPNAGFPEAREAVAERLRRETGLAVHGRRRLHDGRRGRRVQRHPEIDSRSGRRSHRADAVLLRVSVLRDEPRRPHGPGGDRDGLSSGRGPHRRRHHAAHARHHPEHAQQPHRAGLPGADLARVSTRCSRASNSQWSS